MDNDQPSCFRQPSPWQVLLGAVIDLGDDLANYFRKWAGFLGGRSGGCWVSVCYDFAGPISMHGRVESRAITKMRFLVQNRSRFPVVAVEAGWAFRGKGSGAGDILVPLLGEAIGDPVRQTIDAKGAAVLTLDARLVYRRLPRNLEEMVGGKDAPRWFRGVYVRLEDGRVFRSYAFFVSRPHFPAA